MKEFYYLSPDNQRKGPYSLDELLAQNINSSTLIWKAGLAQWTPAGQVPEVASLLTQNTPPVPPTSTPNYNNTNSQYNNAYNNKPMCPPTQLVWAILVTILCCLPFGIVAIIKSSKVENLYYAGRYEEAKRASDSARNWCIWGAVSSFFISAIYIILVFIGAMSSL